jgi:hypothetical protein
MESERIKFSGKITKVTPDGRSGVVALDHEIDGNTFAVISPNTQGRVALMNGHGTLSTGISVRGIAISGVDALRVLEVAAIPATEK